VHELGAFGAIDPAVVALEHPVVLLIGAHFNLSRNEIFLQLRWCSL
jgi:hypothetical protein